MRGRSKLAYRESGVLGYHFKIGLQKLWSNDLRPFIPARTVILGVDHLGIVFEARFHLFEFVCFLADVYNKRLPHLPPTEQPDCPAMIYVPIDVRALRLWMGLELTDHIAQRFQACPLRSIVFLSRSDRDAFPRVAIDPGQLRPVRGMTLIRGDQLKLRFARGGAVPVTVADEQLLDRDRGQARGDRRIGGRLKVKESREIALSVSASFPESTDVRMADAVIVFETRVIRWDQSGRYRVRIAGRQAR